jgi:hypothetical protein
MRQTFEKYKQLIPVLVLAIISIATIMEFIQKAPIIVASGETSWLTPTPKHYVAFAAVAICLIIFFVYRPFYKYVLGATFFLGLFDLINFTAEDTIFSLGLNSLKISFQPTTFYIIILTVIINLKEIRKKREENVQTIEPISNYSQDRFNEQFEKFKETYKNKTSDELTQIVTENKFTPAALEAARQLLNDRGNKS